MKFVISPAKTLDLDSQVPSSKHSEPRFISEAKTLIDELRQKSPADISTLMKLSDKLAQLNVERYQEWTPEHIDTNSRPALFTFMGDVYTGLDAYSLTERQVEKAQQKLRILSGMYGVLKPLDLIQAYRLEMGTKLTGDWGKDLYQFWGSKVADALRNEMEHDELLINLASNEYFKAVNKKALARTIITPNFLDEKSGKYKVISFYAKKARGMMVRYLLENNIEYLDEILAFDHAGYRYCAERSTPTEPVFIRPESVHS